MLLRERVLSIRSLCTVLLRGCKEGKKIINDYFQLLFWEDVWEEIKQPLMVYPPPTGIFLASTNVLVLPKLFKRRWCKYLQPVRKRRASIGILDSCAALAWEDVSGKERAGSKSTSLLRGSQSIFSSYQAHRGHL